MKQYQLKDYKDREHVWSKKTAISDKTLNMDEDFPNDVWLTTVGNCSLCSLRHGKSWTRSWCH